jgi:hypothetical protein
LHSSKSSVRNCDALNAFASIVDMPNLSEKIKNCSKYEYVTRYYYFKQFLPESYKKREDILKEEWKIVCNHKNALKNFIRLIYVFLFDICLIVYIRI